MSGKSLLGIDWRLARGSVLRDSLLRIPLLALAAFALLGLLLSGGANRFLASRYAITAVLRTPVPPGEGEGLARKVADLPPVRSAVYKHPEAAWKEFLLAYPGLDSLRGSGGNPIPGYIEIRLRPERLTAADVARVTSVLRAVGSVEKVLAGEEQLPRLLRVRRFANILSWGVFGAFAALLSLVFLFQERARAVALAPDFAFLAERGIPPGRVAACRAAGAAISVLLLSTLCVLLSGAVLRGILIRYPSLESLIGSPDDLLLLQTLSGLAAFLLCATGIAAASSLLGFRASRK